jgi:hypothetical protein
LLKFFQEKFDDCLKTSDFKPFMDKKYLNPKYITSNPKTKPGTGVLRTIKLVSCHVQYNVNPVPEAMIRTDRVYNRQIMMTLCVLFPEV